MTYKTKSLVYFFCFVLAATAYHITDQYQKFQEHISSKEIANTTFEEAANHSEALENELTALPE